MIPALGISGVFVFHTVVIFLAVVFSCFFMPETRNKSLSELCQMYARRSTENFWGSTQPLLDGFRRE